MFSLCAEPGCKKCYNLRLTLFQPFVQNFLCARHKCNHAVASCRQSTDFLFCFNHVNQSWLPVWSWVSGFTQQDKFTALFLSWTILQTFLVKVEDIFLTFDQGKEGICKNLSMLVSGWFTFPDVAVLERLKSISNR